MELLDKRVGRILGQVRGIQKMVKENRDCVEILQQVSAIKKAIDGLSTEIISLYLDKTLEPEKAKEIRKTIESAINL